MIIYLVRHGETDANKNKIMQGQTYNLQLNETGIRQATNLKQKLKDINFNVCYTSPMIRTWSTAMILVGDRIEIKQDDRLIERYLGKLENQERIKYDTKKYWDYNLNSNDKEVEPIQDIFKRCNNFINYLLKTHNDDDVILIVSHSAITRCLHHIINDTDLNKNLLTFKIDNCYCEKYTLRKKKYYEN